MDKSNKIDYEQLLQFCKTETQSRNVKALIQHGSQRKAAKALGINHRTFEKSLVSIRKCASLHGHSPQHDMTKTVPDNFIVKGTSTLYDKDGNVSLQWVKSKINPDAIKDAVLDLIESLKDDIPKRKKSPTPKRTNSDYLNVFVLGDPHLNMYSYAPETGADWDQEIAIKAHMDAMLDMIARAPDASEAVLATMGDLLHADSLKPITPGSGHVVDVDSRLSLALSNTVMLIRAMIDELLKRYKTVKYVCVRGNHSESMELAIAMMVRFVYEDEPRVEVVDNTPKHIPYVWGKNFLLFTHGDKLNEQRKADIVTAMFKRQHGMAEFSHVLSGHNHHATQRDISGVLVETFPVLPTCDAWHVENGFVSAQRGAHTLTYHKAGGIDWRTGYTPRRGI